MRRIALGELEEARRNPAAYRQKLDRAEKQEMGVTYVGALRHALQRFHKTLDIQNTLRYLETRLEHPRLSSQKRKVDTIEQFEWYVDEVNTRNWPTFETLLRVKIPLPPGVPLDVVCSGEVGRVDVAPAGGYAAWMFLNQSSVDWRHQLRMALIQGVLARNVLGVAPNEISIGIYSFSERLVDSHVFTSDEIDDAQVRLHNLLHHLGF